MERQNHKLNDKQWVHDFLDDQSSEEHLFHPISDQEILTKETELVEKAQIHEKYGNQVNASADWELFKKRMNTGKVVSLSARLLKYAAILGIPLLVASAVFFLNKDKSVVEKDLLVQNFHTKKKVLLILQDGSSVNLQEAKNVKNLKGLQVNNNKNTLDYTNGENAINVDKAVFNTLVVPKGLNYKLVLEDGTEIWVNADTKIKYQVNLSKTATREVYLESGEAYFNVTKNPGKPFIVHNANMNIQVLGTSFNVNAYSGVVYTTLVEGKVKVNIKNESELYLSPNQQAQFDKSTGELDKRDVDVFPSIAWKEGIMVFENITLESLMKQVGRLYDYDYEFNDLQLKQLHFNGRMEKTATVRELLDNIQKTTNVKFNLKDRRIIIEKTAR